MSRTPAGSLAFGIRSPIARSDLPGLCARVCSLLEAGGEGVVVCDVDGAVPDAVTIEALALLQLAARRQGCRVRLRGASEELRELIRFVGLSDVVPERAENG